MKISILTLFPQMFDGPFAHSIVKRAQEKGLVEIEFVDIRQFGIGSHKMVDDTEYGGGIGMLMRVDVIHEAIKHARGRHLEGGRLNPPAGGGSHGSLKVAGEHVILMSASGKTYNQTLAKKFSTYDHLIIICGHYEGIDDRVRRYIDEEISIGDFILTGGEIPAMLITDSVTRLISGVLPEGATDDESFGSLVGQPTLEYPHFTKPRSYDGQDVPEVLLTGDHGKIKTWRHEQALEKTKRLRPDLLKKIES